MNDIQPGKPSQVGISPDRLRRLEDLCSKWVAEKATPALSVLAARRGTIFLNQSWGKLSPAPDSPPVQDNSLFGMASCAKPVTATAVMILVDEGQIGLDHSLQEYLPEFTGPDSEKITIRHLLTHTSGLPNTEAESNSAAENGLDFQPGSKMVYSGGGFHLMGELVERVSGQDFADFTEQRIFKPLGMHNTTFIHMGLDRERCVQPRPGTTYNWAEEFEGLTSGSSTLWSTAYDMGIFLQTFLNRGRYGDYQLLSMEGVDAMTRNQVSGIPRDIVDGVPIPPAGFGWFLLGGAQFPNYPKSFSRDSYGHSGASGAFIWVDPAFDLIGAFLFIKIKEEFRPLDLFVDTLIDCIIDH